MGEVLTDGWGTGDLRSGGALIVFATLLLACPVAFGGENPEAAVSSSEGKTASGGRQVTIENDLYRLKFEPDRGGRCGSFLIKKSNRELVYDGDTAGLFQDHFAHQGYPGELLETKYDYAVEGDGKTQVTLRLWTAAKADPLTEGLKVQKEITLKAGRREVEVKNTFANSTGTGKNVGMWVQQCFNYGGDRLYDVYYRPSDQGVHWVGMDDTGHGKIPPGGDDYAKDWVGASKYSPADGRKVLAGWTAGRDRRTDEGAVFLLDRNYLATLYNCAGSCTTEWFMDKVPLPGGKSWSTEYAMIPVDGFTGFAHASRRLIANVEVKPGDDGVEIKHQVAGAMEPLGTVTLNVAVYGVRSKKEEKLAPEKIENVGMTPSSVAQLWKTPFTEPIVVRVEAAGQDWSERYEYVCMGKFAAAGIEGAGSVAEYTTPVPKKVKTFLKPDTWSRPNNQHLRVGVLYGLCTQHYRIEEAVKALDPAAEVKLYDGWDFFPPTYEELLAYDVLVLSNMPAGPDFAVEMVADFVRHGGGLIALGGMLAYGSGQWRETVLEEIMPVSFPESFDLKWEKPGAAPRSSADHPAVAGVNWPDQARFFWIHEAEPKNGAKIVLEAGKRPALVLGDCGEGRVAAVLATCHGEPEAGQTEAWKGGTWTKLLSQTIKWLKEGK